MGNEIRILLAEDSPTVRRYLASIIEEESGMRVVGEAQNGLEAVKLVAELKPDVVSMDIKMPELDGLEATRRIMAQTPTPIVVVSGFLEVDVQLSLQAIEAGALAVVGKPLTVRILPLWKKAANCSRHFGQWQVSKLFHGAA